MPYITFNCVACGKEVTCHRSKKVIEDEGYPKFCSIGCRDGGLAGFNWKKSSIEDIRKHLTLQFEKHVIRNNPCWEWKGSFDKDGYAILGVKNKKYRRAARVSWFLSYGKMPDGFICHTCENKFCTNPLHLFVGDAKQNSRDLVEKRLQLYGEKNGSSKLTKENILNIRKLAINGTSSKELAIVYNVAFSTIRRILTNKTWKHVL